MLQGAEFKIDKIRAALDAEEWEDDEGGYNQVRRVYLGTVFSCYPSGKFYMPWATGNLLPCVGCGGSGRIRSRLKRRVAKKRARRGDSAALGAVCRACGGCGSHEAYADEVWRENLERQLDAVGASFEHGEGDACDLFAAESREIPDEESDAPV